MRTMTPRRRPRGRRQAKPRFTLQVSVSLDVLLIVEAAITFISLAAAVLTIAQFAGRFRGICA